MNTSIKTSLAIALNMHKCTVSKNTREKKAIDEDETGCSYAHTIWTLQNAIINGTWFAAMSAQCNAYSFSTVLSSSDLLQNYTYSEACLVLYCTIVQMCCFVLFSSCIKECTFVFKCVFWIDDKTWQKVLRTGSDGWWQWNAEIFHAYPFYERSRKNRRHFFNIFNVHLFQQTKQTFQFQ